MRVLSDEAMYGHTRVFYMSKHGAEIHVAHYML